MTALRKTLAAGAGLLTAALVLTACGGSTEGDGSGDVDELTMWARSSTQDYTQALVDAYNADHDTQIKLTIVASDSFQQKVGAAAGAGSLPDILASDVVYAPNYAKQSVYQDISDRVKKLPFADDLVSAHIEASTFDGKIYAVPHKVDSSFIFYNKNLFAAAGLDPENPPRTYDEIYDAAKAIRALGGDTYGLYFPGNCAGCNAYTSFGVARAGDEVPFADDGKKADIDSTALSDWFGLYQRLFADGLVPPGASTGDSTTQQEPFLQGKVGMWPNGSYSIPTVNESIDFEWGYMPLANADGSNTGTFVGGDVVGVTSTTKKSDAAWDFIEWTLEEEAQVDIVAKDGNLPVRVDLSDNEFTSADPRLEAITAGMANGYTPSTLAYGEAINSPNGPWLTAMRGVVFNGDAGALATGQKAIQALVDGTN
ncbi:ABC transporter substrate-binding protein [Microbacterium sp. MAHUQ-60]|uniref:ABC transporter substrate-binding protein n=1 Tax=unclassified Microbacterium TaxID=2609290 RepID=UPI00361BC70E